MLDVIKVPELISQALVDNVRFCWRRGSGNSVSMTSVSEGFCWIRLSLEQLRGLPSGKEIEVAAVIALFPQDVAARIEYRIDGRLRLTDPGEADGVGISVVEVIGEPTPLLTFLSEPCNAMDSLRLLVDTEDEQNVFMIVQFKDAAHVAKGWVPLQKARLLATEADQRHTGDAPSFMYRVGNTIS
jgi:hypothetical protein